MQFPASCSTVDLSAPVIDRLLVSPGAHLRCAALPAAPIGRRVGVLVETVGLPVKEADWAGIRRHGEPQGMVCAGGRQTQLQRLEQGASVGWGPLLAAGFPAPPGQLRITTLIAEVSEPARFSACYHPGVPRMARRQTDPHAGPAAKTLSTSWPRTAAMRMSPFGMTLIAASTDPFLSLVLGFGTAYPVTDSSALAGKPRLDYDLRTGRRVWTVRLRRWIMPPSYTPGLAMPPPPANLAAEIRTSQAAPAESGVALHLQVAGQAAETAMFRSASFTAAAQALRRQRHRALMDVGRGLSPGRHQPHRPCP